jgi:hypothetical protein
MKKILTVVVLALGLAHGAATEGSRDRIVLPNPKLLRCNSPDCEQVWLKNTAKTDAIFPKQVSIDMNQSCLYGMTAIYDKSVPFDEIMAAIDERYGKWTVQEFAKSQLKLWRVAPEKFAIELSVVSKKDEKRNIAEAGSTRAIYIAFGGRTACNIP